MMICPEAFYDMYIKGKSEKDILKQIHSLKRTINDLKYILPFSIDGFHPSNVVKLYWNREYLKVSIKGYEELGFKYIKTKKELKQEELYNKLEDIISLTLSISEGLESKIYNCTVENDLVTITNDIFLNGNMKFIISKRSFVDYLRNIYFHETESKYCFEETVIIDGKKEVASIVQHDGYYWSIYLKFNGRRAKNIFGQTKETFYFEELLELINDNYHRYIWMYDKALQIAKEAHANQVDKAGIDYIEHPLYVSSLVNTTEEKIVALLHDVVEDSDMTFEDLEKNEFYSHIIEAVKLLTKQDGYNYDEYLSKIKNNELARKVKIADLTHNSDISRIKNVTDKDVERQQKYLKAIKYLSN